MKRLLFGAIGAAILAIAAVPVSADQTFWTLDTGKIPTPGPTARYPYSLNYYYVYTPQPCYWHRGRQICPPVPPVPATAPPMVMPTPMPIPQPTYRTQPIARHT